jgi:hypothetical protein
MPVAVPSSPAGPFWYGAGYAGLDDAMVYGSVESLAVDTGADLFDYIVAARLPVRQDAAVHRVAQHLQMLRRARLSRR